MSALNRTCLGKGGAVGGDGSGQIGEDATFLRIEQQIAVVIDLKWAHFKCAGCTTRFPFMTNTLIKPGLMV